MNDISLFDFIDELEPEDIQKEVVAADLSMLLVHANCSRSQLAKDLGYTKSRISRILSGDENLTLKTLTKVADALGYTFDVIFHNEKYDQPKQPWHIDRLNKTVRAEPVFSKSQIEFKLQNSGEVFEDLMAGEDSPYYISINKNFDINKIESLQATKNVTNSNNTFYWNFPASSIDSFVSSLEERG